MKPLSIEEIKQLKENDFVKIVDFENNTTYPPHKSEGTYIVLRNNDKQLMVGRRGYSWYEYDNYGTKWLAYKIEEQKFKGVNKYKWLIL